ncbi:MAG: hypothetical protein WCQ95_06310 [Bacteroidota bacterium]
MKSFFYLSLLLIILSFVSCSTDFDINADQKDITVVYGLLNQSDSTQYIKITKAFLGESSAYEMAQDPALSSYGGDITVTVTEISNGNTSRVFTLQRTNIIKDTGVFYRNQEVYMFKPIPLLNANYTYKLTITNNTTKKETTATTLMVHDFLIKEPVYYAVNPIIGFVSSNGAYSDGEVKWISSKNSRIFEPMFRFHYKEVDKSTLDTTNKYIDWVLNSVKSSTTDGGEEIIVNYNSESFYKIIQSKILPNSNFDRIIGMVDFIVSAGGDDLSIYIDLNEPTSSIIQERPSYTNVTNGIGILSCRYTKKYSYKLNQYSVDKLINGEYTSQLGFK